eukprot:gene9549-12861_t
MIEESTASLLSSSEVNASTNPAISTVKEISSTIKKETATQGVENTSTSVKNIKDNENISDEKEEEQLDPTNNRDKRKSNDYNPNELLSFLGKNSKYLDKISSLRIPGIPGMKQTNSAANLADIIAAGLQNDSASINVKIGIEESATLDQVALSRAYNRRMSSTATRCVYPNCSVFHFNISTFCFEHTNAASAPTVDTNPVISPADNEDERILKIVRAALTANFNLTDPILDKNGEKIKQAVIDNIKSIILKEKTLRDRNIFNPSVSIPIDILTKAQELLSVSSSTFSIYSQYNLEEIELAQLLQQFNRMDIDHDELISVDDLKVLMNRIDPTLSTQLSKNDFNTKCKEMIDNTVLPEVGMNGISFQHYVIGLMNLRAQEKDQTVARQLLQTPFWDLRTCILLMPDRPFENKLLKRGYAMVYEELNSWVQQYFRVRIHPTDGAVLEYYDLYGNDPMLLDDMLLAASQNENDLNNVDDEERSVASDGNEGDNNVKNNSDGKMDVNDNSKMDRESETEVWKEETISDFGNNNEQQSPKIAKTTSTSPGISPKSSPGKKPKTPKLRGRILLRDVILVDYVPYCPVKSSMNLRSNGIDPTNQITFRISLLHGRRYTLAAEEEIAIKWVAELSWYANASRLISEWKENWGTQRLEKVTLRDWINAGAILSKVALQEKAQKNLEKSKMVGDKKSAKLEKKRIKEYKLTPRDREVLTVCGLKDEQTIQQAGGAVLIAVKAFETSKGTLKQYDESITGGAFGYIYTGIKNTVLFWNYARKVKNRYNEDKYQVVCDSKSNARRCAILTCQYVFKSMTFRSEFRKYHCRCCGRVVCHTCSGNKLYFQSSKEFERVCIECIRNNGPPSDRVVVFKGGKEAIKNVALNTGKVEEDEDEEDEGEGEGDDQEDEKVEKNEKVMKKEEKKEIKVKKTNKTKENNEDKKEEENKLSEIKSNKKSSKKDKLKKKSSTTTTLVEE